MQIDICMVLFNKMKRSVASGASARITKHHFYILLDRCSFINMHQIYKKYRKLKHCKKIAEFIVLWNYHYKLPNNTIT